VRPRAGLEGRKISSPPGFHPGPSSPQSVAIPTELPGPQKHIYIYIYMCVCICMYMYMVNSSAEEGRGESRYKLRGPTVQAETRPD